MIRSIKLILFLFSMSLSFYGQKDSAVIAPIILPKTHWTIYYADSVPKIVNGKPFTGSDTSTFISKDEKLLAIETFHDGFKVEVKTFYDNGNPERHYQYKNGKRNGISKGWYKSGSIMFDEIMKDGKDIGAAPMYYENGNVKSILDEDPRTFSIAFYENGKTKSLVKYIRDSLQCINSDAFEETTWHKDGQLKTKKILNCGKQIFRWFYNDTILASEGTIIDMELFRVGKYTEWYKNGKLKLEASYQDGNTQSEANIKTGIWRYWNEKEKLVKEEYYENNELKKTKIYIPEKKLIKNFSN